MTVLIPLVPGSKQPIREAAGWSTSDDGTDWWADAPANANVALRLDDFVVVDADSQTAIDWWLEQGFPTDAMVKTPKGMHFYYRVEPGAEVNPGPLPGIGDLKSGAGHYVLIPPSSNIEGTPYRAVSISQDGTLQPYSQLEHKTDIDPGASGAEWVALLGREAAQASTGLLSRLSSLRPMRSEGSPIDVGGDGIPEGMRNTTLTSFAGLMRRMGFTDAALSRVLNGLNHQLTDDPLDDAEVAAIIRSSGKWEAENYTFEIMEETGEEPEEDPILQWYDEMDMPPPVQWLWKPYLPTGRLVLVDGAEGIGKGMFSAWIAHNVMRGGNNVLWMAAEDDPEEDIYRRLAALGEKGPGRIGFFTPGNWPSFPRHFDPIKALINRHGAKLVIMDPGRSFLGKPEGAQHMSYNDDAAVGPTLQRLNLLARETGSTIIFVHHWNKDTQGRVRQRASGTGAFSQVVRHRLSFAKSGEEEMAEWAFEINKTNMGTAGQLHTYSLVPDPELETAHFELGEPLPGVSLDQWLHDRDAVKTGGSVDFGAADKLSDWGARALPIGGVFPLRDELAKAAGVPRGEVEEGMLELEAEKRVSRQPTGVGNGFRWIWEG